MISFFLIYLIGIPFSVLLHEVGHALGVIIFSKEKSYVYLGSNNDMNKENFRIGRMHFHIHWAYFGFCAVKNRASFSRFQSVMFSAGGPLVSLVLFVASYLVMAEVTHSEIKNFLNGIVYFNLFMFICTSIPVKYPIWYKPYAGLPSDGYRIFTLLKGAIN